MPRRFRALLALSLIALSTAAIAELPPAVYKEWQAKAPEQLVIAVRSVRTTAKQEGQSIITYVTIKATVKQVRRSESHLISGQSIVISYQHTERKQPFAGPSEVPIIAQGESYPHTYIRLHTSRTNLPQAALASRPSSEGPAPMSACTARSKVLQPEQRFPPRMRLRGP